MFNFHRFLIVAIRGLFFLLTFLALNTGDIHAADPVNNLIFIIDASGSMDTPMENQTRMNIVKTALTELTDIIPAQMNVGMIVYGKNRKGDCSDIEEIILLSPLDKTLFTTKVQNIEPEGMTPIALSIQKAVEKFDAQKDGNAIILISDGKDTCTGDPCPLVKEMKNKEIKFVIHVISMGAELEDENQLACIANAGGGLYFSGKNIQELKSGLITAAGISEQSAERYLTGISEETISGSEPEKEFPVFQSLPSGQMETKTPEVSETSGVVDSNLRPEPTKATVKETSARVRKSPSLDSGILFSLKKGDKVLVTEIRNDWYHIRLKNGKTGWAHNSLFKEVFKTGQQLLVKVSDLKQQEPRNETNAGSSLRLEPTVSEISEVPKNEATVKEASARVRKSPSLDSGILFRLKKGDKVLVTKTKDDWYHIRLKNGKTGWAHDSLFEEKIGYSESENTEESEKPLLNSDIETSDNSETKTSEILENSEALKNEISETPKTSEVLQDSGKKLTLNIDTGIIRERPSIYANVKTMIKKGDTVSVIAEKDDKWYQVQLNDGSTGWIHRRLFESSQIQKTDSQAGSSQRLEPTESRQKLVEQTESLKPTEKLEPTETEHSGSSQRLEPTETEHSGSSQRLEPTVKVANKIKEPKVVKKSGMIRLIKDIQFEKSSDTEEKVIFTLNDEFAPAKTFFLNENNKINIVCDFSDTQLAEGVASSVKVNGNLIKTIRIGLHEKADPKLRVVMDMVSGKKYHLNHILIKNEKRYVLIFNAEK